MDSKSVAPVREMYPDVADLAQKICNKVEELADAVETLDGTKWLGITDQILNLNDQLQELLVPAPEPESSDK